MSRLSVTLLDAAKSVPVADRHSASKVWLDDVHAAYCRQTGSRITFGNFSQSLVNDADCRSLLARCDMPFLHFARVTSSNATYLTSVDGDHSLATFNFVKLPPAVASIEADLRAILLDSSACQGLRSSL